MTASEVQRRRRFGGRRKDEDLTRRRPGDGRNKMVSFTATDEELDVLTAAAELAEMSRSEFMRRASFAAVADPSIVLANQAEPAA